MLDPDNTADYTADDSNVSDDVSDPGEEVTSEETEDMDFTVWNWIANVEN